MAQANAKAKINRQLSIMIRPINWYSEFSLIGGVICCILLSDKFQSSVLQNAIVIYINIFYRLDRPKVNVFYAAIGQDNELLAYRGKRDDENSVV
jgi:hypothetical protein